MGKQLKLAGLVLTSALVLSAPFAQTAEAATSTAKTQQEQKVVNKKVTKEEFAKAQAEMAKKVKERVAKEKAEKLAKEKAAKIALEKAKKEINASLAFERADIKKADTRFKEFYYRLGKVKDKKKEALVIKTELDTLKEIHVYFNYGRLKVIDKKLASAKTASEVYALRSNVQALGEGINETHEDLSKIDHKIDNLDNPNMGDNVEGENLEESNTGF